jgi:hypothetical protein
MQASRTEQQRLHRQRVDQGRSEKRQSMPVLVRPLMTARGAAHASGNANSLSSREVGEGWGRSYTSSRLRWVSFAYGFNWRCLQWRGHGRPRVCLARATRRLGCLRSATLCEIRTRIAQWEGPRPQIHLSDALTQFYQLLVWFRPPARQVGTWHS